MKNLKNPIFLDVFLTTWLLFTVAFVVLKIFGIISTSWWWLLLPTLGVPALALMIIGVLFCILLMTLPSNTKLP